MQQQLQDIQTRLSMLDQHLQQTTFDPTFSKVLSELVLLKQLVGTARAEIAECLPMLAVAGQVFEGLSATRPASAEAEASVPMRSLRPGSEAGAAGAHSQGKSGRRCQASSSSSPRGS